LCIVYIHHDGIYMEIAAHDITFYTTRIYTTISLIIGVTV